MVSQLYYLLRSRADGSYLVARPQGSTQSDQPPPTGYLLVFTADYEALSYVNTHAPDISDKFAVETVIASNLKPLISRWDFQGVGMVNDPQLPQIEFFNRS
ncbi:hypothetical protein IQ254_10295 [Nodosilinea sp. LEGE 07088]|uniref:hypothetical protein n=1 Tax=Nodosilinea sp. LEGE 07088 TaxID=2777968 RepID=UPI00188065F6|nr:hypothetical protein [Nodosilinea sp. LEGE 07088]MBE9137598.1 hypothetical protein [Nodosilinea sp. LEGE 07088]